MTTLVSAINIALSVTCISYFQQLLTTVRQRVFAGITAIKSIVACNSYELLTAINSIALVNCHLQLHQSVGLTLTDFLISNNISIQINMTEFAETLNGRVAMLGIIAALGSYALTGEIIPGIW